MTYLRLPLLIIFAFLFFLLLNLSPFLTWIPQFPYDLRRMIELLILAGCVAWLVLDISLRTYWLQCYQAIPALARMAILILFGIGLVSAIEAIMPRLSGMEVGLYVLLLIAGITFATLAKQQGQRFHATIVLILVITIGVYSAHLVANDIGYWFFGVASTANSNFQSQFTAYPGFQNVRFLMSFVSITLPLMVLPRLWYPTVSRSLRLLFLAVSAGWWYTMTVNNGETLWLEWIVIPVFMLFFFRGACWPWLKQQLKAAAWGIGTYLLLSQGSTLLNDWLGRGPKTSLSLIHDDGQARLQLWAESLKDMAHHPLLGIGPLNFAWAPNSTSIAAHPHNFLMMVGAEWGVLALSLLLALLVGGVVYWLRLKPVMITEPNSKQQSLYIALTAALIGGGIDSLLNGTMVMPLSQLSLVLLVGWMIGFYQSIKAHHSALTTLPPITHRAHGLFILLLVIATAIVAYGVFPLVFNLLPMTESFYQMHCGGDPSSCFLDPRFWVQGWTEFYGPYM